MTDPQHYLEHIFGYRQFRGPQQAIIETLMRGDDALVIMPIGRGNSLCYQISSMARPGAGIVLPPLIPLIQDQVLALNELGGLAGLLKSPVPPA